MAIVFPCNGMHHFKHIAKESLNFIKTSVENLDIFVDAYYICFRDNEGISTAKRSFLFSIRRPKTVDEPLRGQPPSPGRFFYFMMHRMDIRSFDAWCRSFLRIDDLTGKDDSLNGIQVSRSPGPITKAAFAVDACAESIRRAAASGAQVLFVHHGLFWGAASRLEGSLLERIRLLLDADMALYACHLPLDMHPEVGNNAVLAKLLGLADLEPFGSYHGFDVGFSGTLEPAISMEEVLRRILPDGSAPRTILASGRKLFRSAAIVSGGAPFEALQAFGKNIDLYITGEPSHSVYHTVIEEGLDFVAAGHYATEVWGVKAIAARLAAEKGIETFFVDLPTGL